MKKITRLRKGITDPQVGDAYTFVRMERNTKLVLAWHMGERDGANTEAFFFFFKQKTAYEIGLGIPAEPLFRSTLFPILASLLVRLVVLLPFQLLRLSLATPSRWTPLALSVFLHCVVALLLTLL